MSQDVTTIKTIQNILIVDDEENTRIGLSELLSSEGYKVESAGDGLEALECLKCGDYHLVITDINMPRMDGMLFLEEVNQKHPKELLKLASQVDADLVLLVGGKRISSESY